MTSCSYLKKEKEKITIKRYIMINIAKFCDIMIISQRKNMFWISRNNCNVCNDGHFIHYNPIYYVLQINKEKNDDTTRIYFTHHITAWVIKGKLSPVSGNGIVQLTINARRASGL